MNVPEWVVTQFAARPGSGAVLAVNVSPAYRLPHWAIRLTMADVATLVVGRGFKRDRLRGDGRITLPEVARRRAPGLVLDRVPTPEATTGGWPTGGARAGGPGPTWSLAPRRRGRSDRCPGRPPARRTSTTCSSLRGRPARRKAMLTHRNRAHECILHRRAAALFRPRISVCVPVPFYHCFGCVLGTPGLRGPPARRSSCRPPRSTPRATLADYIDADRCTSVYGVPTMFM